MATMITIDTDVGVGVAIGFATQVKDQSQARLFVI
jgi:hypothetical protein